MPGYGSTPNVEELPIEQMQMQAEQQSQGPLQEQLTDMAVRGMGVEPKFSGSVMDMGDAGQVDMDNPEEVADFMNFASDAMPPEMTDVGGGVAASHPGQVVGISAGPPPQQPQHAPRITNVADLRESAPAPAQQRQRPRPRQRQSMADMMSMGIGGDATTGVAPTRRSQQRQTDVVGGHFDALVEKGMDPQSLSFGDDFDFSTLPPRERWLARQLGAYKPKAKKRRLAGRRRRSQ